MFVHYFLENEINYHLLAEEIIQKSAIVNKKPLEENLEIDNKVKEILQNYDLPAAPASSEMNSQTLEQNQELSKFEEEIREI